MARIKTEFCPNCGKGEILRYPEMALDYHETCPVCGEALVVPSDVAKPMRVRKITTTIGGGDDLWGAIFDGIKRLAH